MKTIAIAMMCHAINAAYCQSMGDDSQPTWDDAPDWQRSSAIAGVEMHLANPDATPEQSHESWYKVKEAEGWKYGEVKDMEKKEHPCFLPYEELPDEQKAKDYLFRTTVHLVKHLPDPEDYLALSAEVVNLRQKVEHQKNVAINTATITPTNVVQKSAGVSIQYIGNKSLYTDHLYESALTFEQGQVRSIPSDLATKFLKHPEFTRYEGEPESISGESTEQGLDDDTSSILNRSKEKQQEEIDKENKILDEIETIGKMTKAGLVQYALEKYEQKLSPQKNLDELKESVTQMIHQYGVV
ncbi:RyR domain-containing protein [Acinetobacter bereziniae]|uniref:RyR domain-containing protein n=1 Tax=Acinetobacter bereziniae TaxID=106648 RepID=UPI0015DA37E6|nr:RyR domain-containing protein [Acinetobacter bereziniae]